MPRPGGASSSYLVRSDATAVLLDFGTGAFANLLLVLDPSRVDAIVVSHMHADHFFDLVPLRYALKYGSRSPGRLLPVWAAARRPHVARRAAPASRRRVGGFLRLRLCGARIRSGRRARGTRRRAAIRSEPPLYRGLRHALRVRRHCDRLFGRHRADAMRSSSSRDPVRSFCAKRDSGLVRKTANADIERAGGGRNGRTRRRVAPALTHYPQPDRPDDRQLTPRAQRSAGPSPRPRMGWTSRSSCRSSGRRTGVKTGSARVPARGPG